MSETDSTTEPEQEQRKPIQFWDLWIPDAASCGISFARGRLAATDILLAHATPAKLRVEVRDAESVPLAMGDNLPATDDTPMTRLRRQGNAITREDIWPTEADYGTPVILPGGEVGILQFWWHAPDHSVWRWRVEFYNHR
ncbi:MAG: DUF7712 family protein [Ktedonobacterales bacterium]